MYSPMKAVISLVATAVGLAVLASGARADAMDTALLKQAPKVLRTLEEKGVKNAGVLKFRVSKGEQTSDAAGPLNLSVARRLEVALVLANDAKAPVGIIRDASSVAATIPGANHLSADGRKALFTKKYPLAWSADPVVPDAFIAGRVKISSDLRETTVLLFVFDKTGAEPELIAKFPVTSDGTTLADAGESFVLRGAFDSGEVVESAAKVKQQKQSSPVADNSAPVKLEVYYNGKLQPFEVKDGKALIQEPKAGQKVKLVVRRLDKGPDTFGVVVCVNGENTLFRQRGQPLTMRKWVLEPNAPAFEITGFYATEESIEQFAVLSREESKVQAVRYDGNLGTLSMTVFRKKSDGTPATPAAPVPLEESDLLAVQRAELPADPPKDLPELQRSLRNPVRKKDDKIELRGAIIGGEQVKTKGLGKLPFQPDPTPVMAVTVTYYKP